MRRLTTDYTDDTDLHRFFITNYKICVYLSYLCHLWFHLNSHLSLQINLHHIHLPCAQFAGDGEAQLIVLVIPYSNR